MKKTLLAVAMTAMTAMTAMLCATASAQTTAPGPWLVRLRAVNLDSANGDSTGLNLSINNKVLPELDISYFFTPNIAAELVLTVPQKQTLSAGGTEIGSFKHLPPSLTLQYHMDMPAVAGIAGIKPYVGAGVNYTRLSAVSLPPGVDVERNSFGPVLQAGVDIPVGKNLYLNLDVKKAYIRTKVSANGTGLGTFKIDPLLLGVGLGWRF
jgi:outer membrane protein